MHTKYRQPYFICHIKIESDFLPGQLKWPEEQCNLLLSLLTYFIAKTSVKCSSFCISFSFVHLVRFNILLPTSPGGHFQRMVNCMKCMYSERFVCSKLHFGNKIYIIYATSFAHVQTITPSALVFKSITEQTFSLYVRCIFAIAQLPEHYPNHLHSGNGNRNTSTTTTCNQLTNIHPIVR